MSVALNYVAALLLCLWLAAAVRLLMCLKLCQRRRCGRPVESGEVCGPCQAVERSESE